MSVRLWIWLIIGLPVGWFLGRLFLKLGGALVSRLDVHMHLLNTPVLFIIQGAVIAIGFQYGPLFSLRPLRRWWNNELVVDGAVYGLDHGKLNVELPTSSMWMNMGYWKDTDDFPTACKALLVEVLRKTGLLSDDGKFEVVLSVLDLGFGCGDQTEALLQMASGGTPLRYVGVTLNRTQFRFARARLERSRQLEDLDSSMGEKDYVKLFCGNAAMPGLWNQVLKIAVEELQTLSIQANPGVASNLWVLALDTLYHFKPSRQPIFSFAARELGASFMAFDIVRSDSASPLQKVLLRLASVLSGCPLNAFVTEDEYRSMLNQAGYEEANIEIYDITEHVFGPLSSFMKKREKELADVGLKMGSLTHARTLFNWWARSKVVRGVIVVPRQRGAKSIL